MVNGWESRARPGVAPVRVRIAFTLVLDEELAERLAEEADADERSRSQVIRLALREYLERQEARRRSAP